MNDRAVIMTVVGGVLAFLIIGVAITAGFPRHGPPPSPEPSADVRDLLTVTPTAMPMPTNIEFGTLQAVSLVTYYRPCFVGVYHLFDDEGVYPWIGTKSTVPDSQYQAVYAMCDSDAVDGDVPDPVAALVRKNILPGLKAHDRLMLQDAVNVYVNVLGGNLND